LGFIAVRKHDTRRGAGDVSRFRLRSLGIMVKTCFQVSIIISANMSSFTAALSTDCVYIDSTYNTSRRQIKEMYFMPREAFEGAIRDYTFQKNGPRGSGYYLTIGPVVVRCFYCVTPLGGKADTDILSRFGGVLVDANEQRKCPRGRLWLTHEVRTKTQ